MQSEEEVEEAQEIEEVLSHTKGDLNIVVSSCRPSVFMTGLSVPMDVGSEAVLKLIYEHIARGGMRVGITC
ncbi:hypothetical protein ACLOJK_038391 [Asimina triloba]